MSLLSARVKESRSDLATFVRDLEILLDTIGNLLDARSLRGDFQIDRQDTPPSLSSVDRTNLRSGVLSFSRREEKGRLITG